MAHTHIEHLVWNYTYNLLDSFVTVKQYVVENNKNAECSGPPCSHRRIQWRHAVGLFTKGSWTNLVSALLSSSLPRSVSPSVFYCSLSLPSLREAEHLFEVFLKILDCCIYESAFSSGVLRAKDVELQVYNVFKMSQLHSDPHQGYPAGPRWGFRPLDSTNFITLLAPMQNAECSDFFDRSV